MKYAKLNRMSHRWGSLVIAAPLLLVIVTGLLLMLKKELSWVQPPTQGGSTKQLELTFDQILESAKSVPEAEIEGWEDIDRIDVRPAKGMLKVQGVNQWEIQMDAVTGEVLQAAYRRSDLIESLHDGSFFHDKVKLFLFLPSGVLLLVLWLTGIYLFLQPHLARRKRRKKTQRAAVANPASES